jgi:hypothetical protein
MTLLHLLFYRPGYAASCALCSPSEKAAFDTKPGSVVGVLIDVSLHQKKVVDFEREVVNSIFDHLNGAASESFVMKYADKVELLQDWFPFKDGCGRVLSLIELDTERDKNERTRLYDALYAGVEKLKSKSAADSKILIIIGEGNDDGSATRYSQIKQWARSANIQCFALLVADHNLMGGRVRHFGFYLYDLAGVTNGAGYDIGSSRKHLDKAIGNLLERIR